MHIYKVHVCYMCIIAIETHILKIRRYFIYTVQKK